MATYKNVSVGAHVHDGKVIAPNGTFNAQPSANLDKLVAAKVLEVVSGRSSASTGTGGAGESEASERKAALIARAKELGIDAKGTWGEARLQEAIAEAEKSAGTGSNDGGNKGA